MTRKVSMILAMGALTASTALAADTYVIDKGHSDASFQIRHMVSKVRGRFTDFGGTILVDHAKPEASSVTFTLKTASIDTNNADRDKDLRSANFFDVTKFPELTFKGSKIVSKGNDHFEVTGTLTLHGVSKEVAVGVNALGFAKDPWGGERAGFEVTTTLNRKDFGLVWNKTLDTGGLLLGEEVPVTINIEAVKKKETAEK
jgi:polyisoprenoid-binding protein YceI